MNRYSMSQKIQSKTVTREKLRETLYTKKSQVNVDKTNISLKLFRNLSTLTVI